MSKATKDFARGYFCAVATLLREAAVVTMQVRDLFDAGGDPTLADEIDQLLFRESGLMPKPITAEQASVLRHTNENGRYVTADPAVLAMTEAGLLFDYGKQALAAGDHYLGLTRDGRAALAAWTRLQPKPKAKRRSSEMFLEWARYCDACRRIPFRQYYREIWPYRTHQIT